MSLDLSKLENVHETPEKITARCPACAKAGHDQKGDHLVIFPDGKFGCVAHPDDAAHRREIYRHVGLPFDDDHAERGPIPIPIRRPSCATRPPRTLRTLNFHLSRVKIEGGENENN
jgi:hypothetical protein